MSQKTISQLSSNMWNPWKPGEYYHMDASSYKTSIKNPILIIWALWILVTWHEIETVVLSHWSNLNRYLWVNDFIIIIILLIYQTTKFFLCQVLLFVPNTIVKKYPFLCTCWSLTLERVCSFRQLSVVALRAGVLAAEILTDSRGGIFISMTARYVCASLCELGTIQNK